MDSLEYKKYHEDRMTNNTGSTVLEIEGILTTVSFGIFFRLWSNLHLKKARTLYIFVLDFLFIVLPVTFQVTIMSKATYIIPLTMYVVFVLITLSSTNVENIKEFLSQGVSDRKNYISNYRAATNLVSALCILAVDFSIFPRRFAKTETFGFGLMDLGVGYFICSNGIVTKNVMYSLKPMKVIKSSSILIFLGLLRLISVKGSSYHEHASEYGVHWNFFFTLAFSKMACYVILLASPIKSPFFLASVSGLIHQVLLRSGLQDWVFSDIPRDSFISANREGLVSLLGYVSLYFGSVKIGQVINQKKSNLTYKKLLIYLLGCCLSMWICTEVCYLTIGVSRRLANIGYNFWIISSSITVMLEFYAFDIVLSCVSNGKKQSSFQAPFLMESINSNGLFFFLFSNLVTGVINLSFQTLLLNAVCSLLLIVSYMVTICGINCMLHKENLILKYW